MSYEPDNQKRVFGNDSRCRAVRGNGFRSPVTERSQKLSHVWRHLQRHPALRDQLLLLVYHADHRVLHISPGGSRARRKIAGAQRDDFISKPERR
jgi:hypothetical protein